MGLGRGFLANFIELKRSGRIDGALRIVEIGSQQLDDAFLEGDDLLDEIYRLFNCLRADLGKPVGAQNFTENAPPAEPFWSSLGFEYFAIDYGGHRNSVALDLNRDGVPAKLKNSFDLVVNAGTTEHVANQENAFKVIHDLTRRGGVMLHEVPSGGMINHGFFNYHPRFFQNLAAFNLYEVVALTVRFGGSSNLLENMAATNVDLAGSVDQTREQPVFDYVIYAAFGRQTDKEFVTPLDVPPQTLALKHRQPWLGLRHALARRLR
jgi:SAM-dependent methyltransferase